MARIETLKQIVGNGSDLVLCANRGHAVIEELAKIASETGAKLTVTTKMASEVVERLSAQYTNTITFKTTDKALFGDSGTFIHQSSDGHLLIQADIDVTIGVAGDIELGDGTLRVMRPDTDNKIDLGTTAFRFNKLWLSNDLDLEDSNIVLGTTTGTKIGTATSQQLGFYGTTPVNQPVTV